MKLRFLFFFLLAAVVSWGQSTYSYTFTSSIFNANNPTETLGGVDWTLMNNGGYYGYEGERGQQVGSANNPAKDMSLFTSDILGAIEKIKISTSGAKDVNATVEVKVNGTSYGAPILISNTNTEYSFTGSLEGDIEIIWSQNSSKALFFKKIEIEYSGGNSICFSEDFSSLTKGDNVTTNGSSTQWDGDAIWDTEKAYEAGGAVKLGTASLTGFIQTESFVSTQSTVEVQFDVKGWTTVEGDVKVTLGSQTHTFSYTAKMADPFETVSHTFTGVSTGTPLLLKFETTAKRAFLDNIKLYCLIPSSTDHFRSKNSGSWNSHLNWESSSDGVNWATATSIPGAEAESVVVLEDHSITLDAAGIAITNTDVYGTLITDGYNFGVNGTAGADELRIKDGGFFVVKGMSAHKDNGNARGLVESGGTLIADTSNINGTNFVKYYIDGSGIDNLFRFEDGGVMDYQSSNSPASTGYPIIFEPKNTGDLAIFRLSRNISYGSGSNPSTFNAILEITEDRTLTLQNSTTKTFTGGIRGEGTLTLSIAGSAGKVILGDSNTVPILESTGGPLTIRIPTNKLEFANGADVPAGSHVILNSGSGTPNASRTGGHIVVNGMMDMTNFRITNTASGNIDVFGIIKTSHSGGLYGSGSAIVDFESDKVKLRNGSTVEFNGGNQAFNNGIQYYHLVFSGTGTKTPSSTTDIHANGSVTITGNTTVDYSGNKNLASASGSNNIAFNMDGGRLILGTTGTKPNMQGDYNITGGVVEFANTNVTAQTIRNTPDYKYQNIEITGSNVGASSGNTALKPDGSFTVKTGGIYTVRQHSIKCYDSTPKGSGAGTGCSVTVENGGLFRTGNDLGFAGTDSDFGNSSSAIDKNITDITLENGSTVEYLGEKSQEITRDELATDVSHYYNLVISGDKVEPVTGELKVAGVLTLDEHDYDSNHYEGRLLIAETEEEVQPNILYANKGVQINKGELILETNAQLMQDTDAINTGDIFVERKVSNISNDFGTEMDYIYWSSPVANQNLHAFSSGTPIEPQHWGFLEYNEATDYFDNTQDEEFKRAKGYAIRAENGSIPNPRKFEFKGTPQNGVINVTVSRTSEEQGFNLIGNPYPSNIYIDDFFAANSSRIHSKAFFWTNDIYQQYQQGSDYQGNNYAIYTLMGGIPGTGTSDGPQEANPNGIVKVGQGFMIQAKETGAISFKNDQRDTDEGTFYSKEIKDRYWLTLTSPAGTVNTTLIGYIDGATDGYDHDFDADYWGSSDGLYSIIPNRKLIIQGRKAPFNRSDKVQLGAKFYENGVYVIRLREHEGIFNHARILLHDKLLGVKHNLKAEPYKFFIQAGEENNRFEILYNQGFGTSADPKLRLAVTLEKKDIRIFSEVEDIESVKIYNLSGRLIYSDSHLYTKDLRISKPYLRGQILFVHVRTADGTQTVEKLLLP